VAARSVTRVTDNDAVLGIGGCAALSQTWLSKKEETAMAREESEFQKLLSEAPMGPSADTVTVVGALSRTADPLHFVLTLPDGRSEALEVAAVKSAKKIAGAVGQALVELELDAKKIPEGLSYFKKPGHENTGWTDFHQVGGPALGPGSIPQIEMGVSPVAGLAPFAAAMPHQADPATRAALEYWANPFSGTRTYLNAYHWTGDQHLIMKVQADPQ
jgi:hypothetical protein